MSRLSPKDYTRNERMAIALARLYDARQKKKRARTAMRGYLGAAFGNDLADFDPEAGPITPSKKPEHHKFGACRVMVDQYDEDGMVCSICAGSRPYWEAMKEASKAHGAALRAVVAMGKTISEGRA